jgi:FkbM family methyltransferase
LSRISRAIASIRREADGVGLFNVVRLRAIGYYNRVASKLRAPAWWPTIPLKIPGCPTRLYLRTGTSDYAVLRQVFVEQQYAPLDHVAAKLVIDCGAYVGYSALYFLNRFPQAVVVAVEPGPENAALCRRNLLPYRERAHVIRAAVWSSPGPMRLIRGAYGDGREWANQVEPATVPTEADVEGIDMPALIQLAGFGVVDVLKIDIERSEIDLFRSGTDRWLPAIRNVAIELHDDDCKRVFFDAFESYDAETLRSGELTICRSIARARSTARTIRVAP